MSNSIRSYAALKPGGPLQAYEFTPGPLGPEEVEIAVSHCGICHSDLSMLDNEWGRTTYPFVPGHEAVGTVVASGAGVKKVKIGDRVGLGWLSQSCMSCHPCLSGDHNFCSHNQETIVGRHGAFAERVRCHWAWAVPLPAGLDPAKAGPLFCGGITVFNPIVQFQVKPTDRVGVVGVGGLGHMALQFLNKWGCEVIAFSSSASKTEEILRMGAHRVINSRDSAQLQSIAGSLDFILVTVNVTLDWPSYLQTLAPKGRLHVVGAVLEPMAIPAFSLLVGQRSVSGSPLGSPATTQTMLEFAARHQVAPITETFPFSKVNEALDHLRAGRARYRIVLVNDWA